MVRTLPTLALVLFAGCHGMFGDRTTAEDQELNNFAEARQRAAMYYDGNDYVRAAEQYNRALEYKPRHVPTRFGYAYSLIGTNLPSNLHKAVKELEGIGRLRKTQDEVKRVYGLAAAHRNLGAHYQRRGRQREKKGRLDLAQEDRIQAKKYAKVGIKHYQGVLKIDDELVEQQVATHRRTSASLAPDAHAGIAHCEIILADDKHLEHLKRAEAHIKYFTEMTAKARLFWEKRRERLLLTDPLAGDEAMPGTKTIDADLQKRYEDRIANTINEEVTIRQTLLNTLLYLNRYPEAIDEATTILDLDPTLDQVLFLRGHAYAWLSPPNYAAAVEDLKEYRKRQDLTRLTDNLVELNRRIRHYEKKAAEQKTARAAG